jgi:hypothetical protein
MDDRLSFAIALVLGVVTPLAVVLILLMLSCPGDTRRSSNRRASPDGTAGLDCSPMMSHGFGSRDTTFGV